MAKKKTEIKEVDAAKVEAPEVNKFNLDYARLVTEKEYGDIGMNVGLILKCILVELVSARIAREGGNNA